MTDEHLRDSLRDLADSILDRMDERFEAIKERGDERHNENVSRLIRIEGKQDLTNGRITELEVTQAVHGERWINLDRATSIKRPERAPEPDEESPGVKGKWPALVGVGTMLGGILYGLWQAAKAAIQVISKQP